MWAGVDSIELDASELQIDQKTRGWLESSWRSKTIIRMLNPFIFKTTLSARLLGIFFSRFPIRSARLFIFFPSSKFCQNETTNRKPSLDRFSFIRWYHCFLLFSSQKWDGKIPNDYEIRSYPSLNSFQSPTSSAVSTVPFPPSTGSWEESQLPKNEERGRGNSRFDSRHRHMIESLTSIF